MTIGPSTSRAAAVIVTAASLLAQPASRPAPLSIEALRALKPGATMRVVRSLDEGPSYTAQLVSYRSGSLTVHAMVATPKSRPAARGFPVLVANHGTHPNPPKYGIGADGVDARPGDYYRPIPDLYAREGFLVVMPDYRGHSTSEGVEFARGFLASAYYSEDVLALLGCLGSLPRADIDNVFMWGHSLGAEVTLRVLLANGDVRGASLWSTVGGDIWEQAFYYSRHKNREALDGSDVAKPNVDTLKADIAALGSPYDWEAREPLRHVSRLTTPLLLHHAIGDLGAKYEWSERLAQGLAMAGRRYAFYSYSGSDHLFAGEQRDLAVARDVAFFRSLMVPAPPR